VSRFQLGAEQLVLSLRIQTALRVKAITAAALQPRGCAQLSCTKFVQLTTIIVSHFINSAIPNPGSKWLPAQRASAAAGNTPSEPLLANARHWIEVRCYFYLGFHNPSKSVLIQPNQLQALETQVQASEA
jgi:hypothetical protein